MPRGHGSIPFDYEGTPCAGSGHYRHWSGSFVVAVARFLEEPESTAVARGCLGKVTELVLSVAEAVLRIDLAVAVAGPGHSSGVPSSGSLPLQRRRQHNRD